MTTTVNEGSYAWLTISPKDITGAALSPDTLSYRIDDLESGTSIVAEQVIASPGSNYILEITAAQNAILDQAKAREIRRVTVVTTFGAKETTGQFDYVLENLSFLT